jgi:serine/threonine-protein kinase
MSGLRPTAPTPRTQSTVIDAFSLPFQPGEVIGGKYEIIRLIGTGGVGFVVSARHVGFDDLVALKFLRPEFATHAEAVTRFTIEARASFKIKSEHVARVLDVDSLPDGTPFIAMELLQGTDLRSLLDRCRLLAVERAVDYAMQTCEALAAAHSLHIIHRDIKPENLFLTGLGDDADQIKVLDFGISKVALTGNRRQTHQALTRIAVGTPPYMSPEQVRASSDLDARSDIWSLGCVLYELLTGTAPFDRLSLMQSCAAVLEEHPVPVRDLRPSISHELEAVVMRCLQKDPDARYQDVAQLAEALASFGSAHLTTYAERCRALMNGEGFGRPSTPNALSTRFPTGISNHARTLVANSNPTNPPARRRTGAQWRHSLGVQGSRLPSGVGAVGSVAAFADSDFNTSREPISTTAEFPITRPTLLLDATRPPVPNRGSATLVLVLGLGVGAAIAFITAYLLSHVNSSQAPARIATVAQEPTKDPAGVAHAVGVDGLAAQARPSPLVTVERVPFVAIAQPPSAAAAAALLPATPLAGPAATPASAAEPVAHDVASSARLAKAKSKPRPSSASARKTTSTSGQSDEPDVGF